MDDEPQDPAPLAPPPQKTAADPATSDGKTAAGEGVITRRSFMRRATIKTLKITGLTALGLSGITIVANTWSPPPDHPPKDYTDIFKALDPHQPIGVLLVNVGGNQEPWGPRKITHAAWNTYVSEMNEHYGSNWIPVSNATMLELGEFAKQFNTKFACSDTQTHFVFNHHQGHYRDTDLAAFLRSVHAKTKRAIVYSCGPDPKPYENAGCDYVILPRINQRLLGPELSFKLSPGYIDLIGMMRKTSDPAIVTGRLDNRSYLEAARDRMTHQIWPRVWHFESPPDVADNHGAVVTTKTGHCR